MMTNWSGPAGSARREEALVYISSVYIVSYFRKYMYKHLHWRNALIFLILSLNLKSLSFLAKRVLCTCSSKPTKCNYFHSYSFIFRKCTQNSSGRRVWKYSWFFTFYLCVGQHKNKDVILNKQGQEGEYCILFSKDLAKSIAWCAWWFFLFWIFVRWGIMISWKI